MTTRKNAYSGEPMIGANGRVVPFMVLGPHLVGGVPMFHQRQAVSRDVRRRLGLPNRRLQRRTA